MLKKPENDEKTDMEKINQMSYNVNSKVDIDINNI